MSYFDSPRKRKLILDKLRAQLAVEKDEALLAELNMGSFNDAFDKLNTTYWKGSLPKIPVTLGPQKGSYGLFFHSGAIELANNQNLTSLELLGVLLHEMCHHYVDVTYGHGVNAANGGKRVIGHGKEWKAEMRRVGYTGKITRFSGKERFC